MRVSLLHFPEPESPQEPSGPLEEALSVTEDFGLLKEEAGQ